VTGNMSGIVERMLPYREIIFGSRISPPDEASIRSAVSRRDVRLFRASIDGTGGRIRIQAA
jgi:hypothetical protein